MKTGLFTTLSAVTLILSAATAVQADDTGGTLEWQQPGYVMDVIIVTAPRPALPTVTAEAATLAWQEPDYVTEVVIVQASRAEVLAEFRAAARESARARQAIFARGAWNAMGAPVR